MEQSFSLADIHDQDLEVVVERLTAQDVQRLLAYRTEFVELACAACRGTSLVFAFASQGFTYKRCASCGMLMLSPAPSQERQLWYIETSEALRFWREHMPPNVRGSRAKLYTERASYVSARLKRYATTPRRVLEIGAGNGEFAEAFLQSVEAPVLKMVLVEPQPLSIDLPGVEVVSSVLERWKNDEQFDLAVSWEVLEHILDPDPVLCAIRDRLAPDGLLILSTPNEDSFETRLLLGRSANLLYDHVRLYNPKTLALLLKRLGFDVLEIETPGQLDVEIVEREYRGGHLDLTDQPAIQFLLEGGDEYRAKFQSFLRDHNQSGHMRCVARRRA